MTTQCKVTCEISMLRQPSIHWATATVSTTRKGTLGMRRVSGGATSTIWGAYLFEVKNKSPSLLSTSSEANKKKHTLGHTAVHRFPMFNYPSGLHQSIWVDDVQLSVACVCIEGENC